MTREKTYVVKEMFRTIQGEGFHAGTPALFIRFAGCNMWSGFEEDRDRDAVRNNAECPRWCDTNFVGGTKVTAQELAASVEGLPWSPLVVLTGGEPLLQVDQDLIDLLSDAAAAQIAIETNGTTIPKFDLHDGLRGDDSPVWITMSPKRPRHMTVLPWAHELKLVFPAHNPEHWMSFPAKHFFLQPQAVREERDEVVERETALRVADGSLWRLSLQTHKITRMR